MEYRNFARLRWEIQAMFFKKRYVFNDKTLSYEISRRPARSYFVQYGIIMGLGLLCFILYFFVYTRVLGLRTPKEIALEMENSALLSQMEDLNARMEAANKALVAIQRRDNIVYRQIFGMDEIPDDMRNAGFGGVERYGRFENLYHSSYLVSSAMSMDILYKKTYVQSRSFDDVELLARRAGDMAVCVPSICPVSLKNTRITSSFGYRVHPLRHTVIFHEGIDFAGSKGLPVYAAGDGVVESVNKNYFGYGNIVVINHGFGYKTRYAHLNSANVEPGQKVTRGQQIAELGNTGASTGPHLHYEVIYRGKQINPWNFFTTSMSAEEYESIVKMAENS